MSDNTDFTYKNDEWEYDGGYVSQSITLHLERLGSGQINLIYGQLKRTGAGVANIANGWLEDMLNDWVKRHQVFLDGQCEEYLEENDDGGNGSRIDYAVERRR